MAGNKERMSNVESKESVDLTLSNQEIVDKYSSKIKKKDVAEKALDKVSINLGSETYKDMPLSVLTSEVLRTIAKMNPNFEVGVNFDITKMSKDEALAYVAYYQDIKGLDKVDGILGPETYGAALKENKVRVAAVLKRGEMVAEAGVDLDELDQEIEAEMKKLGITKPEKPKVGQTVGIGELTKSKLTEIAESANVSLGELRGLSTKEIRKEMQKIENRRSTARSVAKLKKMKGDLEIKANGTKPEVAKKYKEDLKKVNDLLAMAAEYKESLDKGFVNLEDMAITLGMDVPRDYF